MVSEISLSQQKLTSIQYPVPANFCWLNLQNEVVYHSAFSILHLLSVSKGWIQLSILEPNQDTKT